MIVTDQPTDHSLEYLIHPVIGDILDPYNKDHSATGCHISGKSLVVFFLFTGLLLGSLLH